MARARSADQPFSPADLGDGTYEIPDVGLIVNGALFDGHDALAVAAYHSQIDAVAFEEAAPTDPVVEPVVDPTGQE